MDLISILLSAFHIISAILIVIAVLLQSGKGGGLAGLGGGSSSAAATQMFGGGGAGNFLSRSTVALGAIFMATSLAMAYIAAKPNSAMDLGETSGGVASQEDPILEEGTGPLDFADDSKTEKPDALKLDAVKPDTAKIDLPVVPKTIVVPTDDAKLDTAKEVLVKPAGKDLKKGLEEIKAKLESDPKAKDSVKTPTP